MPHRFPPLRPPADSPRKITDRAGPASGLTFADLCLAAALALGLAFALI